MPIDIRPLPRRLPATANVSRPAAQPLGQPPAGMIADTLNQPMTRTTRMDLGTSDFRIHVSDLMRSDTADRFCPREHVLRYHERRDPKIERLSPGMNLLFTTGHAYHEHVVQRFIEHSPHGDKVWGRWECRGGCSYRIGLRPAVDPGFDRSNGLDCLICERPLDIYKEYTLASERLRVSGHPDLLIQWGRWLIIYEIKTIDREDIDFDKMTYALGAHTLQGSMYYWLALHSPQIQQMGLTPSPDVRYLYVDRSKSKIFAGKPYREFVHRASNAERLNPILDRARQMIEGIESRKLPPRICPKVDCTRAKACIMAVSCFARRSDTV